MKSIIGGICQKSPRHHETDGGQTATDGNNDTSTSTYERHQELGRTGKADDYQRAVELWSLRAMMRSGLYKRMARHPSQFSDDLLHTAGMLDGDDKPYEPRTVKAYALKAIAAHEAAFGHRGPLFANCQRLGGLLGATRADVELLGLAVLLSTDGRLQDLFDEIKARSIASLARVVADMLALPVTRVRQALSKGAVMIEGGLVELKLSNGRYADSPIEVADNIAAALMGEYDCGEELLRRFFVPAPATDLSLGDFPHLARTTSIAVQLLQRVMKSPEPGINLLLFGPAGTGKTALARVLGQYVQARLFEVATEDEDGDGIDYHRRFGAFRLCQRMLARTRRGLILFDEMEDVFPSRWISSAGHGTYRGGLKGWTNKLLEGCPVPTIWVSNNVDHIDPAYLRRFTLVIELQVPPTPVRRAILERHLDGLHVTEDWLTARARDASLTPGAIQQAARVVQLSSRTGRTGRASRKGRGARVAAAMEAKLDQVLEANAAVTCRRPAPMYTRAMQAYNLRYLNCATDLAALTGAPGTTGAAGATGATGLNPDARCTILLHGPPGTGKTALAHELATRLERQLIDCRLSELISMWVGETEKNIADMFRRARAQQSLLLLDEADAMLQDRARAQHSWEVSPVNELLVQMERHQGIFICATNLADGLDAAVFRRFDLKLGFDYLKLQQRLELFVEVIREIGPGRRTPKPLPATVAGLGRLATLTPGDFATVVRRCRVLGTTLDEGQLLAELVAECQAKPGGGARSIGFGG